MKITVPDYYKDFKCIAGACEDTCCAGWEVDVDEDSYRYYKNVSGKLGERLANVMVPKEDGSGCLFRLKPDKRCPFLNERNLCDIYAELGEDALCDTCTYFPRFVHDYGSVREIGTAPSCFTAAQLMVKKKGETGFETHDDPSVMISPNDIDPEIFFLLKAFRTEIFCILWEAHLSERKSYKEKNTDDIGISVRLALILEKAKEVQKKLDDMEYYDIAGQMPGYKGKSPATCKGNNSDVISLWLKPFDGMEIINNDWNILLEEHIKLCKEAAEPGGLKHIYEEFKANVTFAEEALHQLVFYYLYRYVLEAVHDGRLLCAVKTAIVAYLTVKRLCVARFHVRGRLTEDDMADIFHLYSRQIEHSDINFAYFRDAYDSKQEYGVSVLLAELKE